MNGLLGRRRLLELSKELRFQGARAQIYIVGGAAMSLAYSRARRTEDVDARIDAGHSRLTEAVRTVGRRHGWGFLAQRAGGDGDPAGVGRACDNAVRVAAPDSHGRVGQAPVGDEASVSGC